MRRAPLTLLAAAALLAAACAKDNGHGSAAAADSAAAPAPAPATTNASPSGLMGAPAVARQGVDSSNAAQQRRLDEVNDLSGQGSGTTQP